MFLTFYWISSPGYCSAFNGWLEPPILLVSTKKEYINDNDSFPSVFKQRIILQDGPYLAKKDITCISLLRYVATGLFLRNFNIKVLFELTHLTMKAMITVIVCTKHYINSFVHIFHTTKRNFVFGLLPQFLHCKWYS